MSNKKDGVTITWNSKDYYFDGIIGKYIGFCAASFVSGGVIGAGIGSVVGLSVAVSSPLILSVAAVKLVKHMRLK